MRKDHQKYERNKLKDIKMNFKYQSLDPYIQINYC